MWAQQYMSSATIMSLHTQKATLGGLFSSVLTFNAQAAMQKELEVHRKQSILIDTRGSFYTFEISVKYYQIHCFYYPLDVAEGKPLTSTSLFVHATIICSQMDIT